MVGKTLSLATSQFTYKSAFFVWIEAQEVPGEVRASMGESVTKSFEEAFQAALPAIESLLSQLKAATGKKR